MCELSSRDTAAAMRNIVWVIAGFCAAAAGFLVLSAARTPPIDLLAHRLEDAWADHHTIV